MLYVLTCLDKPDSGALRAQTRPAHLDYIRARLDHVVLAGPLVAEDGTTPLGSMLVVDFPGRAELDRFVAEDPYGRAGLFGTVTVQPFRKVFPEG